MRLYVRLCPVELPHAFAINQRRYIQAFFEGFIKIGNVVKAAGKTDLQDIHFCFGD